MRAGRGHRAAAALAAFAVLAVLTLVGEAADAGDDGRELNPPRSVKLAEFAQRLYHPAGQQRLSVIGDSINATNVADRMQVGYRDQWHVPWNGWVVHADNGASDMGYTYSVPTGDDARNFVNEPGNYTAGGDISFAPVRFRETTYAHHITPGQLLAESVMPTQCTFSMLLGNPFRYGQHVTARPIFFTSDGTFRDYAFYGLRDGQTIGDIVRYHRDGPLQRIAYVDIDLGNKGGWPGVRVVGTGKARGEPADRLVYLGTRLLADGDGVQASFISHGGWRTMDHLGQYRFRDSALREWYGAVGAPTHCLLWLGQNQTPTESGELAQGISTEFKTNIKAIIDRHDAAVQALGEPLPRWLLVSQFKTGYSDETHRVMSQALADIATERARVSFLNLYEIAGGENFDSARYTTDGVHPNLLGSNYLAALMDVEMNSVLGCRADFDGSGFVDFVDWGEFMFAFAQGQASADIDGSGFVDLEDLATFLDAFEAGC